MAAKSAPPLITVGSWETNSKHWLVVSPSIQSVKDLVGKSLATSRPKAADEGYARIILRRFGVDPSRVTFLSAGGQRDRMSALRAGSVQGSVFNTYNSLILEELGFKKLAMLETDDFPARHLYDTEANGKRQTGVAQDFPVRRCRGDEKAEP
jgi:NitT/TauT family transport system substrate-binding protein